MFLVRRLAVVPLLAVGVAICCHLLMFALPGDAAQLAAGPGASPETIQTIRSALGLDLPLWRQTLDYVIGLLHGDLGISARSRQPIRIELAGVIGSTLALALLTEVVAAVVGIGLGTLAALSRRRWVSPLILAGSAVSLCLPLFAVGLVLQLIFALWLRVLPPSGGGGLFSSFILLPALTCVIPSAGFLIRFVKTAVQEHASEDFVRTSLANGLGRRRVIVGQVLRASLTPIIAIVTNDLARLLGGIALVEVIFARPGIGKYAFDALQTRDLAALEGSVLVISLAVLVLNTLAESCYALADRRSAAVRAT